jgi:hypothetical protein
VPSYEFAANATAKDENFKAFWLRHSIFSVGEVQYLPSLWKCLFCSRNTLSRKRALPRNASRRRAARLAREK